MALFTFSATQVADSPWTRTSPRARKAGMWMAWAVTWAGLLAGFFDRGYWGAVVWFSAAHALVVLAMVGFRPLVFPAQLRIAYFAWVALGTFAPGMAWMMVVTTVGLATNLFIGWCPLARALSLLPWNREEPFNGELVVRTFFSKPAPGRFVAPPGRHES